MRSPRVAKVAKVANFANIFLKISNISENSRVYQLPKC